MAASPPVVLTISAHDPLGGAGIAADLATFAALGVHGTVAVTAVTAQRLGSVDRVEPTAPDLLEAQLDGIISSLPLAAVKVGLLGSVEAVLLIADRILSGRLPAPVVDPVLVDGRGARLGDTGLEVALRDRLFPLAAVVTPNLREVAVLTGTDVQSPADVASVAHGLAALGAGLVVATGGAVRGELAVDVAVTADAGVHRIEAPWIDTPHVRGSGCTFAAATAAGLALGDEPLQAVSRAKQFVSQRLAVSRWPGLDGVGPVAHWFDSQSMPSHPSP
ncbi:MAG: bifunctional hydroxymethylpyrimidine kinase/phosphomethylpyrimidine kinase [Acidimicrobiales bacterium]